MWASYVLVSRPGMDFSVLANIPCCQNRKCTAKLKAHCRRPAAHFYHSWMRQGKQLVCFPTSSRDKGRILKYHRSGSLVVRLYSREYEKAGIKRTYRLNRAFSTNDMVVEEPWLCQSPLVSPQIVEVGTSSNNDCVTDALNNFDGEVNNTAFLSQLRTPEDIYNYSDVDVNGMTNHSQHVDTLRVDYLVEEPWLTESSICTDNSTIEMVLDASSEDLVQNKVASSVHDEELQSSPESFLHEEGSNETAVDNSISTLILINSSLCTVQRIAVLENDKLVELLLEPVKNNVQCDSVYLGVVTKLVPHMGGAFLNIGSSRPSFMDIKSNREPFILPPFHGHMKEIEVHEAMSSFTEVRGYCNEDEEIDDLDNDQSEDEFNDEEFKGQENNFHYDVLDVIKENVNGSLVGYECKTNQERSLEPLDEDAEQLESKTIHQAASQGVEVSKWAQVRKGSKIIVQVVKEGLGTKGPTLTAYPKLKSRFWILITRCNMIGISKKISGVERTRLRVIAKTLQPPGFGLTVRTVAAGHSLEELQKDLERLLSTWKNIVENAKSAALAADEGVDGAVPILLHKAMSQTLSVAQDYFNEKVKSMVVDSPRTYHEVTNYLQDIAPNLCDRIELYSKKTPLFDEYNIEGEINNILSKRVPLDNGGYLVIEQTEALVSIDVNGGHCMLGQGTSQEKAILEVNLAAAKQIAREIRLRDIGGIIVVDFIDMMDESNKRHVYEEIKRAVERDRSTVKVSELSRHGLMEITRKRVRPSVTFMISEPCTCCHGTGRVEALETSFSKIEHEICRLLATMDQKADVEKPKSWPRFILRVDRHMCNYLTSGKRTRLAVLSSCLKVWILLKVARGLTRGAFELKPLADGNQQQQQQPRQGAISVLRPPSPPQPSTTTDGGVSRRKVTLFPISKWKTGK
ncbi:ribonuclease E/G-like protein, chloroplastic isoform X2 [Andrographis paniculata]|uniref:ribonuclease E/G-like protein, chloroplastic isoform X2 n=1 Tax=Andrographis paniculata TaxID=175694 RepID=UPI0021E88F80|nr:ribonuclease E/G-like protein, chloroplastic isoform X2 [Andrographis paniculata]